MHVILLQSDKISSKKITNTALNRSIRRLFAAQPLDSATFKLNVYCDKSIAVWSSAGHPIREQLEVFKSILRHHTLQIT